MVSDLALGSASAADSMARAFYDNGDVHPVDSDFGVILLPGEVSIITNAEGKVSLTVKVPGWNGVVTAVESVGQELVDDFLVTHGCFASNGHTQTDLEVTVLDPSECALGFDTSHQLQNVFSIEKAFSALTDTDVNADLGHT